MSDYRQRAAEVLAEIHNVRGWDEAEKALAVALERAVAEKLREVAEDVDLCCERIVRGRADDLEEGRNPTTGLWDKRNTSSGYFEAVKRSGDVFKGVRREN